MLKLCSKKQEAVELLNSVSVFLLFLGAYLLNWIK